MNCAQCFHRECLIHHRRLTLRWSLSTLPELDPGRVEQRVKWWLELVFGALLPTVLLGPYLIGGLAGTLIAGAYQPSVLAEGPFLLMIGAVIGLIALWTALVLRLRGIVRRYLKIILFIGLVIGLVSAVNFASYMWRTRSTFDLQTWIVWILVLGGPMFIGARNGWLLLKR